MNFIELFENSLEELDESTRKQTRFLFINETSNIGKFFDSAVKNYKFRYSRGSDKIEPYVYIGSGSTADTSLPSKDYSVKHNGALTNKENSRRSVTPSIYICPSKKPNLNELVFVMPCYVTRRIFPLTIELKKRSLPVTVYVCSFVNNIVDESFDKLSKDISRQKVFTQSEENLVFYEVKGKFFKSYKSHMYFNELRKNPDGSLPDTTKKFIINDVVQCLVKPNKYIVKLEVYEPRDLDVMLKNAIRKSERFPYTTQDDNIYKKQSATKTNN